MSPTTRSQATVLLLLTWLLYAVMVTLFPFDFRVAPAGVEQAGENFGTTQTEVVLNLLLFVPLGALLHHHGQGRRPGLTLIAIAGAAGLLISLTFECLQALLPHRDSSVIDLLSNTAGALAGAIGQQAWGARVEARVARLRAQASPAKLVCLMVGFTVLALMTSGALQLQTRLSDWSAEYPLLIGNEQSGDRPWRGRMFAFELTDAATPSESVRRFSVGGSPNIPGRRIAAFDFSGSPPYRDAAGALPSLDWTERPSESSTAGGIRLPGRPWLRTEGPASAIAHRLGESNAFTLRVVCASDNANQSGPARIISNSLDTGWRNFTLGQQGRDMVFRFRTPLTGFNGSHPEVVVPGVFATDHRREILVTYDGGTLLATVANSDQVYRTELTPGASLASKISSLNIQADELQMINVMYLAALFFLPAVLVGLLGQTGRGGLAFGVLWVLVFGVLLEGTLVLVSGRPFEWGSVAANVVVGVVVLTLSSIGVRGYLEETWFLPGMPATETRSDA